MMSQGDEQLNAVTKLPIAHVDENIDTQSISITCKGNTSYE